MVGGRCGVLVGAVTLGMLTTSCGSSDGRGPLVPEVAKPIAASGGDGGAAQVETSRPKDLVVLARFRNPEESLDATSALSGTPLSMALSILAQTDDGKGISSLDLREPIDLAVTLPAGTTFAGSGDDAGVPPLAGVSFTVLDVERATTALPEGWTARPSRTGLRISGDGDVVCESPVRGHVSARIFCGSSEAAAKVLGGWMTQTLVRDPLPPVDVRFTIFGAPARAQIRALIGAEIRGDLDDVRESLAQLGVTDPELVAVPGLLVDELEALAEDSDQIELDVDLDSAGRTATAKTTIKFRSTTGWVARVLADPAERRGPPPAIFWRAPKDSESASWSMSASPRYFTGIRRVYDKAVRLATSRAQLPSDETSALIAASESIPTMSGAWFVAQGTLPWKAPAKGNPTPQNAITDFKDRARSYVGWGIVGLESPATPWVEWFGRLDAAWKKGVAIAKREAKGSEGLEDIPDVKLVRNPGGYPAGSVALDVVGKFDSTLAWHLSPRLPAPIDGVRPNHPAGKPVRGSATLRIVAVPDGARTFIGWSLDDSSLRAHVRAALHGAPDSGTIAARTDLGRMKRDGTGGGYFSFGSVTEMVADLASVDAPELAEIGAALKKLPNKGSTPILTFADGTAGSAPTLSFEVIAQEGTFEDVRALTGFGMSMGLRQMLGAGALQAIRPDAQLSVPSGIISTPPAVSVPPAVTSPPATRP